MSPSGAFEPAPHCLAFHWTSARGYCLKGAASRLICRSKDTERRIEDANSRGLLGPPGSLTEIHGSFSCCAQAWLVLEHLEGAAQRPDPGAPRNWGHRNWRRRGHLKNVRPESSMVRAGSRYLLGPLPWQGRQSWARKPRAAPSPCRHEARRFSQVIALKPGGTGDYLYSRDPEAEAQRSGQGWTCLSPSMPQLARCRLECFVVVAPWALGWAGDSRWWAGAGPLLPPPTVRPPLLFLWSLGQSGWDGEGQWRTTLAFHD